ncbi:uncharacterized [Tachysurus ichikawai]
MDAGGEAAAPAEELEVNAVAVAEAELVVAVLVQELTDRHPTTRPRHTAPYDWLAADAGGCVQLLHTQQHLTPVSSFSAEI